MAEDSLAMLANSKGSEEHSPTHQRAAAGGAAAAPSPSPATDEEEDDEVGLLGARSTSARRGKGACSTPRTPGGLLTHLAGSVVGAAGGSAAAGAPSSPATPPPASITRGARESLLQESDLEAAQRRLLLGEAEGAEGAAASTAAAGARNGASGAVTGPLLASAEQALRWPPPHTPRRNTSSLTLLTLTRALLLPEPCYPDLTIPSPRYPVRTTLSLPPSPYHPHLCRSSRWPCTSSTTSPRRYTPTLPPSPTVPLAPTPTLNPIPILAPTLTPDP